MRRWHWWNTTTCDDITAPPLPSPPPLPPQLQAIYTFVQPLNRLSSYRTWKLDLAVGDMFSFNWTWQTSLEAPLIFSATAIMLSKKSIWCDKMCLHLNLVLDLCLKTYLWWRTPASNSPFLVCWVCGYSVLHVYVMLSLYVILSLYVMLSLYVTCDTLGRPAGVYWRFLILKQLSSRQSHKRSNRYFLRCIIRMRNVRSCHLEKNP